ncbi:MAG: zinc-ribbon domain-containing protein [Oscillospiraceae bacterium]
MFCKKCGKEIKDNSKFCAYCGYNINQLSTDNSSNININTKTNDHTNIIFAWIIAVIPIISELISLATNFGYFGLILNIILCYIDEDNLKKQGVNTERIDGPYTFLVPVYLYRRAELLNDSKAYFVCWCICMSLIIFFV